MKLKFTLEQKAEICERIGLWYFKWKNRMTENGECHRLGFAKEELKEILCDNKEILP